MNVHIMSKAAASTELIHIHFFFFLPALTVKRIFFFFMIYGFPALIIQTNLSLSYSLIAKERTHVIRRAPSAPPSALL